MILDKKGLLHHRLTYSPPNWAGNIHYVVDIQEYQTTPRGSFWKVQLWDSCNMQVLEQRLFPMSEEHKALSMAMQLLEGAALGNYSQKREPNEEVVQVH